ncbi:MAG: hypothetical protein J0I54_12730 [Bosea sp.]|uniref:hypothetical protein n=1 Tax=unclassified Bosea (in: a-proteobacteria) TaxID=2653178 RepID=UPI00096715C4|nr:MULTISPECIES: hypothetical protein [unclassified Bosea (in: a-proteobacteria)]MBN9457486.1 hypothetical protein [Bosea sp. (in: a-proteobacteria)]OJV09550.1 MAG: hypothetical protein BGO20_02395 [Bosea sp. 67-29]
MTERISLGPVRHRGDLRRALDVAVEIAVDRQRQQLAAAGFEGLDLHELVAAERRRFTAWAAQVESEISAELPEPPMPTPAAA